MKIVLCVLLYMSGNIKKHGLKKKKKKKKLSMVNGKLY